METLVLYGPVPSKKNKYKIRGDHRGLYKPKEVLDFEKMFAQEVMVQRIGEVRGKFRLSFDVYYGQHEPDMDGVLTTILDCLQKSGVIKNDKDCVGFDECNKFYQPEKVGMRITLRAV